MLKTTTGGDRRNTNQRPRREAQNDANHIFCSTETLSSVNKPFSFSNKSSVCDQLLGVCGTIPAGAVRSAANDQLFNILTFWAHQCCTLTSLSWTNQGTALASFLSSFIPSCFVVTHITICSTWGHGARAQWGHVCVALLLSPPPLLLALDMSTHGDVSAHPLGWFLLTTDRFEPAWRWNQPQLSVPHEIYPSKRIWPSPSSQTSSQSVSGRLLHQILHFWKTLYFIETALI